jgi:hypothetical protein
MNGALGIPRGFFSSVNMDPSDIEGLWLERVDSRYGSRGSELTALVNNCINFFLFHIHRLCPV